MASMLPAVKSPLPPARVNPARTKARNQFEGYNDAFADAMVASFPQDRKEAGLVRVLVEQGMPFETAEAQAREMMAGSLLPPVAPHMLGRGEDTEMIHVRPDEIPAIQDALDFPGTVNPRTGYLEFGGGGGSINGPGGSGNVGGGGRGNARGGGIGNTGRGEQSRSNTRPGQQQGAWGNRATTSYGAPVHTGKYGSVALNPEKWGALSNQVGTYNQAANKWNDTARRSFGNFVNNMEPMGFSFQAPQFGRPKTYVDGDYHLGLNPAALAGSILGGATMIPGAGTAAGFLAGKAYEMSGMPNVMLGGGDVPSNFRSDLSMGPGTNTTPQNNPGFRPGSGQQPTAPGSPVSRTAQGASLLPPIAGAPPAPAMTPAAAPGLPPVATPSQQLYPGGYRSIPGPTPYGWLRPSWAA